MRSDCAARPAYAARWLVIVETQRDRARHAEAVGRYAAERALARLQPRALSARACPVLFEAPLAAGLLGAFVRAVSGVALYRRASFLVDRLGERIFAPHIQIHEAP